jgi:UDP-glucose 4-epimerase
MKHSKILITGGAGRLGYEVAKMCSAEGYNVRAFDLPNVKWSHVENLDGVESFKGDLNDVLNLREACRDVDILIHLAAILPPKSEVDRHLTMSVNVEGTKNLLTILDFKVPIVFSSSVSTYGVTALENPPIMESHAQVAHDFYSESKIRCENLIMRSGRSFKILRIAPISVADLVELPDVVAYRAEQRIECIFVEDAAQALLSCLNEPNEAVYNIGGGESWQMNGQEYLVRYYRALGIDVEPNYPIEYTALDWYDTSKSTHLRYQRTSFNMFERKLEAKGLELGLR